MSLTGCYAESQPAPAPVVSTTTVTGAEPASGGYEPAYFDGYVVFYDEKGTPFHYAPGGKVVPIPPSSSYYQGLANHYRTNEASYRQWYTETGYRYRGYRGPAGHYYYRGYVLLSAR